MNGNYLKDNSNENMVGENNINVDQIEGSVKTTKTRKILLIIFAVLIVLSIIFYFLFGNAKQEPNEYTGTKDLQYVEQIIADNEYFMFDDNGQKYVLFKLTQTVYEPQTIEILSARIYNKSYTEDRKFEVNINLDTEITKHTQDDSNDITIFNEDSMIFIQKVEPDCTGLIVNNIEYKAFEGGIVENRETQKYGYIDANGNFLIPTEYSKIEKMDNTYYSTVSNSEEKIDYSNYLKVYKEGAGYGVISKDGENLIDCQYATIINFDQYTFAVTKGDNTNAQIGVIDLRGNVIKEFRNGGIFDNSEKFNKYAIVTLNNKKGVLDRNLNEIVPIEYDSINMRDFAENNNSTKYLFAAEKNGQYEVFDETGKSAVNESLNTISQVLGDDVNEQQVQDIYSNILNSKLDEIGK